MAEAKAEKDEGKGTQGLARPQESRMARRWDPGFGSTGPFEFMERMAEEMDRWFERVTGTSGLPRLSGRRSPFLTRAGRGMWLPKVEAGQKGDTFFVRADLPGLKKEDVDVNLTDDAITIRGERRSEHEEDREGYWRSEREYGEFQRTIPLPEGVIAESAKATFRDGVLEITMQAPPAEAHRGRKLEIKEEATEQKK